MKDKTSKWKRVLIKDVCESVIDCVNKTAPTVEDLTPYKMIRTTNVKAGKIDLINVKYVKKEIYDKWTRRSVPRKEDVILTREAPLGDVGMLRTNDTIFLGQRLIQYRADPEKLDNHFLLYSFQACDLQAQIKSFASGATVEHMRVPDAEKLTILLPDIFLQKKIASILANYDDLIENNTRRIEILEEMTKLVYEEWFIKFRFPGHENLKIIDGVPEGWETTNAFNIMNVLSGGTPKTSVPEFWDGGIPFFTPRDSTDTPYVLETEKNISEQGLSKCNSRLYPKDTIFITARGTVGKLNLAQIPMAMNQSCYALVGKEPLTQYFLYCSLHSAIDQFKSRAVGAVFDAIVVDTFKVIPFVVPSQNLIYDFTEIITPIFKQIDNLIIKNQNLQKTRDLLLPKLISGEIDVSDLNIRIRNENQEL